MPVRTLVLAFGLLSFVAACSQPEEVVYVDPEPISSEPVSTGKYK